MDGIQNEAGGKAIIDAQPVGCGRNADELKRLSEESGIHIVASTGFHKLQFYPDDHWVYSYSGNDLINVFLSELHQGMYIDCDNSKPWKLCKSKAGIIKAALDCGEMSNSYRKLFAAAAEAAKQAGAALMVHIEQGSNPNNLADFLEESRVSLTKVIFCHMDRAENDLEVHKELCKRGITMEYDTIGRLKYHSDFQEASIIAQMVEAGFENQILLGLDVTRARYIRYGGWPGLPYLKTHFIEDLSSAGVSPSVIQKIFYDNPAEIFSINN